MKVISLLFFVGFHIFFPRGSTAMKERLDGGGGGGGVFV